MQAAIETAGLVRTFGDRRAVDGVDLIVPERSVFGFLGPNGAGKTTTLRLILGLMRSDAGTIHVFGMPMPAARAAIARSIGALVETPSLYDHLTGRDNLRITARLIGVGAPAIERALAIVKLEREAGRRVGGYSLGMRQRLGLARALLGAPRLLILDEPTNGLDPEGMIEMRQLLAGLPDATGATVLVSSHLLGEIEQIATHVALMRDGRLLAQGTLGTILSSGSVAALRVTVDDSRRALELLSREGIVPRLDGSDMLIDSAHVAPEAINARLVAAGIAVSRLTRDSLSLAHVYARLSGLHTEARA